MLDSLVYSESLPEFKGFQKVVTMETVYFESIEVPFIRVSQVEEDPYDWVVESTGGRFRKSSGADVGEMINLARGLILARFI